MDYTLSNAFATDVSTGNRMHQQSAAVPTAVTDQDMNGVMWELMSVIKAAGITPVPFDRATPASYTQLLAAIAAASRSIGVTASFAGTQTLATNVPATVTLAPSVTACSLYDWAAGIFTFKKAGTYRFTSKFNFDINQASGTCAAYLAHIYALGAGNTTVFSPAPLNYVNNKAATNYVAPGGSSGSNTIFDLNCDGTTLMSVGDKLSLQAFTDSNATMWRRVGSGSIAQNILTVQYLG